MFKRGTLIITFVLIFMLFAGQPAVSADEDVSLLDNLELYGGPLYTRPAMTEFMDYFEELEVGFQEYFELIEAFIELDYELGEIEDYDFADSYDIPEGPVGALGFYGGLAAENEQGIRAATGFERFYMDFSGSADYEVWVDLGEDQGEIEEEVEISQEIDEAAISENETEVLQEDMSGWKFRAGLGYQF